VYILTALQKEIKLKGLHTQSLMPSVDLFYILASDVPSHVSRLLIGTR
jgi:hypothetical protein